MAKMSKLDIERRERARERLIMLAAISFTAGCFVAAMLVAFPWSKR